MSGSSRLNDPNFMSELRKVLAIEFEVELSKPEIARLVPDAANLIEKVRTGQHIPHRTYLDAIVHTVAESFVLSPEEEQELRSLLFTM